MAVIAVLTMRAEGYPYLLFKTADGTIHAMSVESLTMEISRGQLVVTNSEETQTFTLSDLDKMFFYENTTGIDEIFSTGSGGKGMKCDGIMTISGGDITVVTTGGLYYNDGTNENLNYTGDTDQISNTDR